jgi:glycosyltransferase involved in cell wall biosynthesis
VGHDDWPKIKEIHCGLEPEFYQVDPVPVPDTPRLVCVGRICEQKGQLLLLEAANHLKQKGLDFELVLAGDGEMRPEIERLIARYGLQDRVHITGWISSHRVREELLAARALVLPSFAEGLPVVIMEALALRRPVLTSYVAGIPELVSHGANGWLFPAGSVDALVTALEAMLATSSEVLDTMGEAGYRCVVERHCIDTEASKLMLQFARSVR